jgi:hypothetical protein
MWKLYVRTPKSMALSAIDYKRRISVENFRLKEGLEHTQQIAI